MKEPSLRCGIYAIQNVVTGDLYVGQSRDIARRYEQHTLLLEAGNHHCALLQKSWHDHGKIAFCHIVLENCPECDLGTRERYWLERVQPKLNAMVPDESPGGEHRLINRDHLQNRLMRIPQCQMCGESPARAGRRYCKACECIIKGKMKASGYLRPAGFRPQARSVDQRENTYETKHG